MQVFFSPSAQYCSAIDVVQDGVGAYSGKTLEEFKAEYPDIQIVDDSVSVQHDRQRRITAPKEISEDDYTYLLEVLPPCRWSNRGGASVFHISDRITYDIVTWCVRIGERYFSLDDSDKLNGSQVIDMVATKFFPFKEAA